MINKIDLNIVLLNINYTGHIIYKWNLIIIKMMKIN